MTTKLKILTGLAGVHFILVVLGAAGVNFYQASEPWMEVLRWYGEMTGASSQHGFFAPGVPTPNRIAFEMIGAEGESWADEIGIGKSSEANLRLEAVTFDWPSMEEVALKADPMIRSFVATMFERHPEAVVVRVHYQFYGLEETVDFPTMEEYRQGRVPEWITARSLDYERKEVAPKDNIPTGSAP